MNSVYSTAHARERRQERDISSAVAVAKQFGMKERSSRGQTLYTYQGNVFVVDPHSQTHITCYHSSDWASPFSGTRVTTPTLYPLLQIPSNTDQPRNSRHAKLGKRQTVAVVSMGASMRQDDVNGGRSRSDAVWAALAKGLVEPCIDNPNDMSLSVIALMDGQVQVIIKPHAADSRLYNRLLMLRNYGELRPSGVADPAAAMPLLANLLENATNQKHPIETTLYWISDNDLQVNDGWKQALEEFVSNHATSIIRVAVIGVGNDSDSFAALNDLVGVQSWHNVPVQFHRSRLELSHLIELIQTTEVVSTADVPQSPRSQLELMGVSSNWTTGLVGAIWSWNNDQLVKVADRRCRSCYAVTDSSSFQCASCHSAWYCLDCFQAFAWHLGSSDCQTSQSEFKSGLIVERFVPSYTVAWLTTASVEAVFHGKSWRFLDSSRQPIATALAKPIATVEWQKVEHGLVDHFRRICRDYSVAARMSTEFNKRFDQFRLGGTTTIRILEPLVMNIEGAGCYLVTLSDAVLLHSQATEVAVEKAQAIIRDLLESFSHYSVVSLEGAFRVMASKCAPMPGCVVVTELSLLEQGDVSGRTLLQGHRCNQFCRKLGLSTKAASQLEVVYRPIG